MAGISLSINREKMGFAISDYTVGTLTPNANDIELRFNTTDQNSNPMLMIDVIQALEGFIRALEQTGGNVNIITPPTE